MTSLDIFLRKKYDIRTYNCANFACDVWRFLTGIDIQNQLSGFLNPPKDRTAPVSIKSDFVILDKPQDPCLVLFRRKKQAPHVGVWTAGSVIHIQKTGVEYMPLDVAKRGFTSHKFYGVKHG